jgi:hypothetical protein
MAFNSTDPTTLGMFRAEAAIVKGQIVKITAAGLIAPCTAITDKPIGVAIEGTDTTKVPTSTQPQGIGVQYSGVAKVKSSAALAVGAIVATSTGALAQASATTQYPIGQVVEASTAANEFCSVLLRINNTPQA